MDLSRRKFLQGAAVVAGAGAAATLSSCSSKGELSPANNSNENASVDDVSWDEEFDIVVVGAGLAGSSAAVAVALEGAGETCLLIEKGSSPLGSGNSPFSGGMVLLTDEAHKADCITYLKTLRGPFTTTPDSMLEVFAEYMASTMDFMKRAGAKEEDYIVLEPGEIYGSGNNGDGTPNSGLPIVSCWPEYPEIETSSSTGRLMFSGEEISTVSVFMHSAVEAHSDIITMKTNAVLIDLIQDQKTKAVIGVVYDDNGRKTYVKANLGVIMCVGGFERNQEMMEDYHSMPHGYHLAGPGNTGDGFPICAKLGAGFWHMNAMAGTWNGALKFDGSEHGGWFSLGRQYGITVGAHGRRYYMDVDYVVSMNWSDWNNGTDDVRTSVACRHGHFNFGGEWPHIILPETSWFIFDNDNLDNAVRGGVRTLTEGDPVEEGWAVKADTIEGLAEIIDVPAKELVQTVEAWNECCDKGVDTQFYRPLDWQTKIEQGPFYAIRCEPEYINTDGGPVRNAKAEILDQAGNPIPNLYSSGEFGSLWCNMYQGGGNLSECVNFSRIAVDSILGK